MIFMIIGMGAKFSVVLADSYSNLYKEMNLCLKDNEMDLIAMQL
jgi:hypothetical protein